MILHRFCSEAEYKAFMRGERLTNYTDHGAKRGYDASTAVGFCFFVEDPEEAKHWLSGIVDFDFCLTLDIPDHLLRVCHGRYPAWVKPGVYKDTIRRTEFSCTEYDNGSVKLLKASTAFRTYAPNASLLRKHFPQYFL